MCWSHTVLTAPRARRSKTLSQRKRNANRYQRLTNILKNAIDAIGFEVLRWRLNEFQTKERASHKQNSLPLKRFIISDVLTA